MTQTRNHKKTIHPACRRLQIFAFDPLLSQDIDTYGINQTVIKLPWEELKLGPMDNYLEVVDYDPASQRFYPPVDLNDTHLLAQDGLSPSEGNPQFHQQMVYAVARKTISHFEQALGRKALWSPYMEKTDKGIKDHPVNRLRIYPHALREANAYYSPAKKALLFGYFPASVSAPGKNLPGGTVFTALSHDIVAHEMTHALLDGLHRRFIEPTNIDVWAFHEAFADIVALFQHFTYPDVLRHQIARTRGGLEQQNLLGELASQFGQAIERYGALRSAIGHVDPKTKKWIPEKPDPEKILTTTEPHQRGAILVAAVFDAFLTIYKRRIADLLRIASGGTGVLPEGELHPDLVERLAQEAAKAASHVLNICIRALDYCPPVDIDFGDYLRALITADFDLVSEDQYNYRLAFIEAFRRRGIYPKDVRNLSVDSLLWHNPEEGELREFAKLFSKSRLHKLVPDWGLTTDRGQIYKNAEESQRKLQRWLMNNRYQKFVELLHLVLDEKVPEAFYRNDEGIPKLEIHSVRPARRIGPGGQTQTDLVIEITQRRRGYFDPEVQHKTDTGKVKPDRADFIFRGGCSLIIDLESAKVRYCIYKRIRSQKRLQRMREFLTGDAGFSLAADYYGNPYQAFHKGLVSPIDSPLREISNEPFTLLHQSSETEELFDV